MGWESVVEGVVYEAVGEVVVMEMGGRRMG